MSKQKETPKASSLSEKLTQLKAEQSKKNPAPKAAAPSSAPAISGLPPKSGQQSKSEPKDSIKAAPLNSGLSKQAKKPSKPSKPLRIPDATKPVKQVAAPVSSPPMPASPASGRVDKAEETAKPAKRLPAGPARRNPVSSKEVPSIGGLIYALEAKPSKSPLIGASVASLVWLFVGGLLGWSLVSNQYGNYNSFVEVLTAPSIFIIASCVLVPIAVIWLLAILAMRSQEMKLMASAMTEVAIRLAEPDQMAEQQVASVGQSIRRQVNAMNEAITRAVGRAGELETMVHNEVAALERSYTKNEVMIKGLLSELATERQEIVRHGDEVKTSLEGVGEKVSTQIKSSTEGIASNLNQKGEKVAHSLEEMGNLIDRQLEERSVGVAKTLAKQSAKASHDLFKAKNLVTAQMGEISDKVAKELPQLLGKLEREQSRLNTVVKTADSQLGKVNASLADRTDELAKQSDVLNKSIGERTLHLDNVLSTHVKTINKSLTQRVLALDASLAQRAKSLDDALARQVGALDQALDEKSKSIDTSISQRTKEISKTLDRKSKILDATLAQKSAKLDTSLQERTENMDAALQERTAAMDASFAQKAGELDQALGQKATQLEHSLGERTQALDVALDHRMQEMNRQLEGKAREMNSSISQHVTTLDEALADKAIAIDSAFAQKARALDASLEQKAKAIDSNLTDKINQMDSSLARQAHELTASLTTQTDKMRRTLYDHSSAIENSLTQQTAVLGKTLAMNNDAIRETTDRIAMTSADSTNALTQQAQMLQQASNGLMSQIESVTTKFDTQGVAILDAARELDASHAKFGDREEKVQQMLSDVTHKAEALNQNVEQYTAQMESSLAEADRHAREMKAQFAQDKSLSVQQTLAEVEKLQLAAKAQTRQAVAQLQDRFSAVTQQVNQHVENLGSQKYQNRDYSVSHNRRLSSRDLSGEQEALDMLRNFNKPSDQGEKGPGEKSQVAPNPGASASAPVSIPTSTEAAEAPGEKANGNAADKSSKASQWSMGELLSQIASDEANSDEMNHPAYKPASGSQGSGGQSAPGTANPNDLLSVEEIARSFDARTAEMAWRQYQAGQTQAINRGIYSPEGQQTFDQIQQQYHSNGNFKATVEQYVADFEGLIQDVEKSDPAGNATLAYLTSDTGRVYIMLAHASGRLGKA